MVAPLLFLQWTETTTDYLLGLPLVTHSFTAAAQFMDIELGTLNSGELSLNSLRVFRGSVSLAGRKLEFDR